MSINESDLVNRFRSVMADADEDRRNQIVCIVNAWGWPREMGYPIPVGHDRYDACRRLSCLAEKLAPGWLRYHGECNRRGIDAKTGLSTADTEDRRIDHDGRNPLATEEGGHVYAFPGDQAGTPVVTAVGCEKHCGASWGPTFAVSDRDVDPFGVCPGPAVY